MKLNYSWAVLGLVLALGACSTEVVTDDTPATPTTPASTDTIAGYSPEGHTIFGMRPQQDTVAKRPAGRRILVDMTHSRGGEGVFTWVEADKIWVERSAGDFVSNSAITIADGSRYASFTYDGTFGNATYNLRYVGNTSTNVNQVTIPATQTQAQAGNSAHFAASGDCGVAVATKDAAHGVYNYNFELQHAPTYLALYPRVDDKSTLIATGAKIVGVEVEDLLADAQTPLSGTFAFSETGLGAVQSDASHKVVVDLTTNLALKTTYQDDKPIYAIINPGQHQIKVTYKILTSGNKKLKISHTIDTSADTYAPNKVYDLTTKLTWSGQYYYWDAVTEVLGTTPTPNSATTFLPARQTQSDYASKRTNNYQGFWASYSASEAPTYISMSYMINALTPSMYYDTEQTWEMDGRTYKGGLWLLKLRYHQAYGYGQQVPSIQPPTNAYPANYNTYDLNSNYYKVGTPSESEKSKYTFLPAKGRLMKDAEGYYYVDGLGSAGYYWLSTGNATNGKTDEAYAFCFGTSAAGMYNAKRTGGESSTDNQGYCNWEWVNYR